MALKPVDPKTGGPTAGRSAKKAAAAPRPRRAAPVQYRRSNMTFRLFFLESLRFGAAPAALQLPSSQLKAPMDGAHWHAQLVA